MSFGNVPRDYFSADIRTVGSLLQYQRSPGVWAESGSGISIFAATQV